MKNTPEHDPFLETRLARYDRWLSRGQISFASRVIPVAESLPAQQWVLPTGQVLEILRSATSVALQNCECRTHYGRCDKPREVCLVLNDAADKLVAVGAARRVSLAEAADALRRANAAGLVHLGLYMPDHRLYALCSCCACCCHDLQLVQRFGRTDLLVRSDYVAVTDMDACRHCGDCVDRCVFGARTLEDGHVLHLPDACVGCGLCVTVCPAGATTMQPRAA